MTKKTFQFSTASTTFYFNAAPGALKKLIGEKKAVFITDNNIFKKQKKLFHSYKTIVIKAGEQHKVQQTVNSIIDQLIAFGTDRNTFLVGVGGGVVTDITGYVAAIYLRGVSFGFVPTTILAMVDASIGGKNGIDVGLYKNMVGTIKQPSFLFYDYSLLKTLPQEEWINGFAEIIKHACIKDQSMFKLLENNSLQKFRQNAMLLNKLIQRNALLKSKVVMEDEFEKGNRKLLNFGHTLGHAIENKFQLPHGHAVSIGMCAASYISAQQLSFTETARVISLLKKYKLPVSITFNVEEVLKLMKADKKKQNDQLQFILLNKIGSATVHPINYNELKPMLVSVSEKMQQL